MNYHLFDHDKFKIDFAFSDQQLNDFRELWNEGISVENIAKKMKRTTLEVALLVIDRAELGIIKGRSSGLNGF